MKNLPKSDHVPPLFKDIVLCCIDAEWTQAVIRAFKALHYPLNHLPHLIPTVLSPLQILPTPTTHHAVCDSLSLQLSSLSLKWLLPCFSSKLLLVLHNPSQMSPSLSSLTSFWPLTGRSCSQHFILTYTCFHFTYPLLDWVSSVLSFLNLHT